MIIQFWLKQLRPTLKLLSVRLMIESRLLSIRIFLVQVTVKIGKEKYLSLVLFWTYKIKDLIGKKIIGSFHEKELVLIKL